MRAGTSRGQEQLLSDLRLRVDTIDQRGVKILDPVKTFNAQTATAKTGATVNFQVYRTTGVDRIEVLRNTSRDTGSASVIQAYPANQIQLNRPLAVTDSAKFATGQTLFYWLRAVPLHTKFQPMIRGPFMVTVT